MEMVTSGILQKRLNKKTGNSPNLHVPTTLTYEKSNKNTSNLWHIHVIHEVDELLASRRPVVASGLLLQRFFQDALQHLGRGVEVKRDVRDGVVLAKLRQFVVDDDGLA